MVHEREVPKNDPGRKGGLLMSPDSSANVDEDSDSKTDLFDQKNVMFRMGATSEIKTIKDKKNASSRRN